MNTNILSPDNAFLNKTHLRKDGIIHSCYIGDQSYESVKFLTKITDELIIKIKDQQKRVLLLVDLTSLEKSTFHSRRATVEALNTLKYDKIAIFGSNLYIKNLANLIVKAAGKTEKVRYFDSKELALEWLKHDKNKK